MARKLTSFQRMVVQAHGGRDLRDVLKETYAEHGTVTATAEHLGVDVATLRSWLRQYGLEPKAVKMLVEKDHALAEAA